MLMQQMNLVRSQEECIDMMGSSHFLWLSQRNGKADKQNDYSSVVDLVEVCVAMEQKTGMSLSGH
jgi:hypothetical protein